MWKTCGVRGRNFTLRIITHGDIVSSDIENTCGRVPRFARGGPQSRSIFTTPWRTHSCVPRSHSCERSGLVEEVFARVRTRHAKCVRHEFDRSLKELRRYRNGATGSLLSPCTARSPAPGDSRAHDSGGLSWSESARRFRWRTRVPESETCGFARMAQAVC